MMQKETTYKKICKKRSFILGFDALWGAGDHLLLVCNNMFSQSYKRFFFSDIQALRAKVTKGWIYLGLWQGGAALFFLICALFSDDMVARVIFGVISGLFLIGLIVNWIQGPSCEASIVTRVQSHSLPIGRLNKAKKVFASLRNRIEKAQGKLDERELDEVAPSLRPAPDAKRARPNREAPPIDHSYSGLFHLLFFSGLLVIAGMNGMQLYARHEIITLIEMVLLIAVLIFMVLGLARQRNSTMPGLLKKLTWTGLGVIFFLLVLSYVDLVAAIVENIETMATAQTQMALLNIYVNRDPNIYVFFKFTLIFHAVSLALIAIPGLWQTLTWQKQRGEVPE